LIEVTKHQLQQQQQIITYTQLYYQNISKYFAYLVLDQNGGKSRDTPSTSELPDAIAISAI